MTKDRRNVIEVDGGRLWAAARRKPFLGKLLIYFDIGQTRTLGAHGADFGSILAPES